MAPTTHQPHRHQRPNNIYSRRGSSAAQSSTSSLSGDDLAITPCPSEQSISKQHASQKQQQPRTTAQLQQDQQGHSVQGLRRSNSWRRESEDRNGDHASHDGADHSNDNGVDPETLWRRMLAIQRIFGCYNSARMRAAIDMGVEGGFVPSMTCLDLLNDSIDQLPEESKRQVEEYLAHGGDGIMSGGAGTRKSWRWKLLHLHMPALG
ncbi:hypothetical protein B0T17DRAFT_531686 [Bombardia bombarda]|uniref:Uncharacterized protein n=1 Tax=Bombardia bombarda TaxID=252184 RepID=A0AA39X0I8_9PEZI|nr:hypothetical protein B0T17DRAFT_531686 [Bombardia bombarda]